VVFALKGEPGNNRSGLTNISAISAEHRQSCSTLPINEPQRFFRLKNSNR